MEVTASDLILEGLHHLKKEDKQEVLQESTCKMIQVWQNASN